MVQTITGHVLHIRQSGTEGPTGAVLVQSSSLLGFEARDLSGDPSRIRDLLHSSSVLPIAFAGWPSPPSSVAGSWLWDTSALCFFDESYHLPPKHGNSLQCGELPWHMKIPCKPYPAQLSFCCFIACQQEENTGIRAFSAQTSLMGWLCASLHEWVWHSRSWALHSGCVSGV